MDDLFADPRLTLSGLLLEATGGLLSKLEPVMRAHGLSNLDLNALMRLSRSPGRRLRMSDLAAQTSLTTSGGQSPEARGMTWLPSPAAPAVPA